MGIDEDIGSLVSIWRKASGLSQDALAQLLGLQQAAVSKIETGKQTLTVEQFLCILESCDVPPDKAMRQLLAIKRRDSKPLWERIDE